MASPSSGGPRRRSLEIPLSSKDSSLAEWASEIRKLQQEVDREAEVEARRLEEEIAASRLQRLSRRQSTRKPAESSPLAEKPRYGTGLPDGLLKHSITSIPSSEKQRNVSANTHHLTDEDGSNAPAQSQEQYPATPFNPNPSLASIFGSKANGPRLNKHAPQHNIPASTHNPLLLRTSPSAHALTSAGQTSGRVPLPGLSRQRSSPPSSPSSAQGEQHTPAMSPTPKGQGRPEDQPVPAQLSFTPIPSNPQSPQAMSSSLSSLANSFTADDMKSTASSETPPSKASSLSESTGKLVLSSDQEKPTALWKARSTIPLGNVANKPTPINKGQSNVTHSSDPLQAFKRSSASKDLTPSLSRLQGRGFVANQVKTVSTSPAHEIQPSRTPPPLNKGRGSILDRWPVTSETDPSQTVASTSTGMSHTTPKSPPRTQWPPNKSDGKVGDKPAHLVELFAKQPLTSPPSKTTSARSTPTQLAPSKHGQEKHSERKSLLLPALPVASATKDYPARNNGTVSTPLPDEPSTRHLPVEPIPETHNPSIPLAHPTRDRAKKPRKAKASANASMKTPLAPSLTNTRMPTSDLRQTPEPSVLSEAVPITVPFVYKAATQSSAHPAPPHQFIPAPSSRSAAPHTDNSISSSGNDGAKENDKTSISKSSSTTSLASKISQLTQTWENQAPIGVRKPPSSPRRALTDAEPVAIHPGKRRALPGLVTSEAASHEPTFPTSSPPLPSPWTSSRRTVMDIARGMQESLGAEEQPLESDSTEKGNPIESAHDSKSADNTGSIVDAPVVMNVTFMSVPPVQEELGPQLPPAPEINDSILTQEVSSQEPDILVYDPVDVRNAIANWGKSEPVTPVDATPQIAPWTPTQNAPIPRPRSAYSPTLEVAREERRRSSYEKYASIMLPPLAEEKTPAPSPMGSLTRRELSHSDSSPRGSAGRHSTGGTSSSRMTSAIDVQKALLEHKALLDLEGPSPLPSPRPVVADLVPMERYAEETITFTHSDDSNDLNIRAQDIIDSINQNNEVDPTNTISVDVMLISGNTATPIRDDPHIFYDVEVRAIIHRAKSMSSGLVKTLMYGWRGKRAEVGPQEARKLGELAHRFGTSLIPCIQGSESPSLVRILGGVIVTRQGSPSHWSPENTAMHCVREADGAIFIDQVEPEFKNLCSGFSFVAVLLDQIYIRHGKGSTPSEQQHAISYAQTILPPDGNITEFSEGQEDPMFSLALGEDDCSQADYWKFRPNVLPWRPRLYRIDVDIPSKVQHVEELASESLDSSSVFILDGVLELYIIVGAEARASRREIGLALSLAKGLSELHAPHRPFSPPVHALILPSKVPLDLKLGLFRYFEEDHLNPQGVPSHMNLVSFDQAMQQFSTLAWPKSFLDDITFLPLGLCPSDIPPL